MAKILVVVEMKVFWSIDDRSMIDDSFRDD